MCFESVLVSSVPATCRHNAGLTGRFTNHRVIPNHFARAGKAPSFRNIALELFPARRGSQPTKSTADSHFAEPLPSHTLVAENTLFPARLWLVVETEAKNTENARARPVHSDGSVKQRQRSSAFSHDSLAPRDEELEHDVAAQTVECDHCDEYARIHPDILELDVIEFKYLCAIQLNRIPDNVL